MIRFSDSERAELSVAFEQTQHKKVHVVYLRSMGIPRKEIAAMFLMSLPTVTTFCKLYKDQGIAGLLSRHYKGRCCRLSVSQQQELEQFLEEHYVQGPALQHYLRERWGQCYSRSGALRLVHRLGYVSKKRSASRVKPIPMNRKPS